MDKIRHVFVPANDKEIIDNVLTGNTAMFELLMRRCNSELYKLARCYGFNHQDSEDLMQEAYISAYANLHQFQYRSSFKTWISKILIHKCQYKLEHGHAGREMPLPDSFDEIALPSDTAAIQRFPDIVARKEFSAMLEAALQEMPLNYRLVFILREVEGFSVAETATLLEITEINVKVRTNRAKAILQKKLESYYSAADIYEFNEIFCDKIVDRVLNRIAKT
jgi:RNA polymerase sigma factor (sigma-70 family)